MSRKAFVASTFEDLRDHRAHVIKSLRAAGFHVDPMEEWTSAPDAPKRLSPERLEGCEICVLLVALRRGHVPEGETLSITQLEYEAALARGVHVFVYLLDEQAAWPRPFDELDADPELRRWRGTLAENHVVSYFNLEPESIDLAPALTRFVAAQETGGKPNRTERSVFPIQKPAGDPAVQSTRFARSILQLSFVLVLLFFLVGVYYFIQQPGLIQALPAVVLVGYTPIFVWAELRFIALQRVHSRLGSVMPRV